VKRLAARPAVFGLIACVVIAAVWYQLLWKPQSSAIASAHGRERTATASLFTAEQRLGHLKKLAANATQLALLDQKLSGAVPDKDSADGFIVELNAEAQAASVGISSLAITPPATAKSGPSGVQTIGLQMNVSGGYFDVQRFLDAIRGGSRLVVIDQLSMSAGPAKTGGSGSAIAATIVGRLFVSSTASAPLVFSSPVTKAGTGVLETPINAARNAVSSANATGGTP
jgi:Tfp pilus assembly protein PilO